MKKIIEYTFVFNADHEAVEERVNELIKKGWQPLGAPNLQPGHGQFKGYFYFAQVMVKYSDNV
jgi:hypothetical protein